jgi:hypothetical protein
LVQSSNVEIQSLVNNSSLFGVLGIKRVILGILVDKIGEDGAAGKLKIQNYVIEIMDLSIIFNNSVVSERSSIFCTNFAMAVSLSIE